MDDRCQQVRRAIQRGDAPSAGDVAAHARTCEDCRDRIEAAPLLGRPPSEPTPPVAALAQGWQAVLQDIQSQPPILARLRGQPIGIRLALFLPVLLAALSEARTTHPASAGGVGESLVPRALSCFVYGALFSAPVVGLALLADRGRGRLPLPWLLAPASAGLVANALLQLHCALTHPAHLLAGHASIGVVLVAVALLANRLRARAAHG